MAFGISPKYIEEYNLEDLSRESFLVIAKEAAIQLKWDVSFLSETGFLAYTKISFSSYSEEVSVKVDSEKAIIKSECTGTQFFDWGKNKNNVKAFLSKLKEVRGEMSQEEMVSKWNALKPDLAAGEEDVLSQPPLSAKEKFTGFFSVFRPVEGYAVTPVLMMLNILVFILMAVSGVSLMMPEGQDLLGWGANFKPLTLDGQPWRLFTSCFLHIGILHLGMNMYALLYIGVLLEPYLGKTRFLAAYLISGIAASVASLWWNEMTISAGASGAIFGMYGVFLALLSTNLLDRSAKNALLTSIAIFVGYNLLNGLKPDSGIDNAAHIGGLLSGFLVGYAYVPSLKAYENRNIKFSIIGALTLLLLISSFAVYNSSPNDIAEYDKKMKSFVEFEEQALEVFSLPESASDDQFLYELQAGGIHYWNQGLELLESCDTLELPGTVIHRNARLKEYCKLRIQSYELIVKAIEENTDQYQNKILGINQKIEAIIQELSGLE